MLKALAHIDGYWVSENGDVFRSPRLNRPLVQTLDREGYPRVRVGDRRTWKKVASLVLIAWVGPRPPGMECRHLNGDRTDSRLENLSWGTKAENEEDRRRHGKTRRGELHGFAKLSEAQVAEIKRRLIRGDRQVDIARDFGVIQAHVSRIKRGIVWNHVNI